MAHAWGHKGQRMKGTGQKQMNSQYEKGGKVEDRGLFNFPSKDSRGRMDSYEEGGEVSNKNKITDDIVDYNLQLQSPSDTESIENKKARAARVWKAAEQAGVSQSDRPSIHGEKPLTTVPGDTRHRVVRGVESVFKGDSGGIHDITDIVKALSKGKKKKNKKKKK